MPSKKGKKATTAAEFNQLRKFMEEVTLWELLQQAQAKDKDGADDVPKKAASSKKGSTKTAKKPSRKANRKKAAAAADGDDDDLADLKQAALDQIRDSLRGSIKMSKKEAEAPEAEVPEPAPSPQKASPTKKSKKSKKSAKASKRSTKSKKTSLHSDEGHVSNASAVLDAEIKAIVDELPLEHTVDAIVTSVKSSEKKKKKKSNKSKRSLIGELEVLPSSAKQSAKTSQKGSAKTSQKGSAKGSIKASQKSSTKKSAKASQKSSAKGSAKKSQKSSAKTSESADAALVDDLKNLAAEAAIPDKVSEADANDTAEADAAEADWGDSIGDDDADEERLADAWREQLLNSKNVWPASKMSSTLRDKVDKTALRLAATNSDDAAVEILRSFKGDPDADVNYDGIVQSLKSKL